MARNSGRYFGIVGVLAGMSFLVTSCGELGRENYLGGVVVDPGAVSVNVSKELVSGDDVQAGGLERDGFHTTIDQRTVTLSGRAEYCSDHPDVVLDADGESLKVHLVMPPDGERCMEGENYLITIKLARDFDEYELRG